MYQYPNPPEPISQPLSCIKLKVLSLDDELIKEVSVGFAYPLTAATYVVLA